MSETPSAARDSGEPQDEPGVTPGAPGPSGTGEATTAGGDPAAPARTRSEESDGD